MATITMTPSHFGSSLSGGQATYSADAPSMADTLPNVDFGFNDLRERMAQFTARFDDFIERGRKRVLEERNAFRMNIAEVEETERNRKQAIQTLESQSLTHASTRAKEDVETEEMREAIRYLGEQKENHLARRDQLKGEIASVQNVIRQRREAQAAYQRSLDAQARHNVPELRFWEHCLGLRIEGTGVDDQLRFVYGSVDERDGERLCSFEMQMGGKDYEVVHTSPKLGRGGIEELRDRLNETRELGPFLKGMRTLLVEAMRT